MKLKYYISAVLFSIIKLQACSGYGLEASAVSPTKQNNNIIPSIPYDNKAEGITFERPSGSYTPLGQEFYILDGEIIRIAKSDILKIMPYCNGKNEYQKEQQSILYLYKLKKNQQ